MPHNPFQVTSHFDLFTHVYIAFLKCFFENISIEQG